MTEYLQADQHSEDPEGRRIEDLDVAWGAAHTEKPYRELEIQARAFGLGQIATDIAQEADNASDNFHLYNQKRYAPEHERQEGITIKHRSFEEARQESKQLSDAFIDGALGGKLRVGEQPAPFIKSYLDKVETDERDMSIIENPERIAGVYQATTDMLMRNLTLWIATPQEYNDKQKQARKAAIVKAKTDFLSNLDKESSQADSQIVDWCNTPTSVKSAPKFPVRSMEYYGLVVDGGDVLDAESKSNPGVRPNFKIQRQIGTFIMGYSDKQVEDKLKKDEQLLDKRIYMNPDIEATPELFESLLLAANEANIPLQLKMLQRASELAAAYKQNKNALRGDGVVVYANEKQADEVLDMVLQLAEGNPEAFKGRKTSRIPKMVAEGIAVGDEPVHTPDQSLTSHRADVLEEVTHQVGQSGKRGQEAHDMFRSLFEREARANGIDPNNLAFNVS